MKIKTETRSYADVCNIPPMRHIKPTRPSNTLRKLIYFLSGGELKKVGFTYEIEGLEDAQYDGPCLYLMNHSSFTDLEIASRLIWPHPYNIVCTSDGFVGKEGLIRRIGCIPTRKFQNDLNLVKDIKYCFETLQTSVLMYPEASYSFDGTATPLPEGLAKLIKILGVPVIMIKTEGAFIRDPLYNGLRLRDVKVSARMYALLSKEEIKDLKPAQIDALLREAFTFDNFRDQQEKGIKVTEDFRAIGLERALYKCPHCMAEDMTSEGTKVFCKKCGAEYELTEDGFLKRTNGETKFDHVPDWYKWERESVREEIEAGKYHIELPVKIRVMADMKAIYEVGEGTLTHTPDGFHLTGCDGALDFTQSPKASYSLYADYFWYELGDMVCIGDKERLYYCFPPEDTNVCARMRLATEEMYKLAKRG